MNYSCPNCEWFSEKYVLEVVLFEGGYGAICPACIEMHEIGEYENS